MYSTSGQYDLLAEFYLESGADMAASLPTACCRCPA